MQIFVNLGCLNLRKKIVILFLILFNNFLFSEVINLKLPAFGEYGYYHELLKKSLEAEGYEVKITELPKDCEQKRVMEMMGADSDQITLTWVVQTEERDREFIPVEVGITNGLIGKRILLIPKGSQNEYDGIKTIEDLKKLEKVGGFGKGWFDIKVWECNGLKTYEKDGSWDPEIYRMVASKNRGIDYFSRGAHEIAAESGKYPELDVEKRVLLVYDKDMRFYLTKSNKKLKPILERALKKAKKRGIIESELKKYYPELFDKSKFDIENRVKIRLKLPKYI